MSGCGSNNPRLRSPVSRGFSRSRLRPYSYRAKSISAKTFVNGLRYASVSSAHLLRRTGLIPLVCLPLPPICQFSLPAGVGKVLSTAEFRFLREDGSLDV